MTFNRKEYDRKYREEHKDKCKESHNKSIKKNPELYRISKRKWNKKNLVKKAELARKYRIRKSKEVEARNLAQKIKIPINEKCELCKINLAMERHHPNYNQPLEVMFLCVECHGRLHLGRTTKKI